MQEEYRKLFDRFGISAKSLGAYIQMGDCQPVDQDPFDSISSGDEMTITDYTDEQATIRTVRVRHIDRHDDGSIRIDLE